MIEADQDGLGVAQRIEQALRQRIVRGDLAPESPLRQDHIAREFSASAIPVREALRRLESTGLVEFRPRRGAVVSAVSAADAWEVAEMRASLEGLALDSAMRRRTDDHVARVRAAIVASDASTDALTWLAENRKLHRALYEASERPRLLAAIEDLWLTSDRHLMIVWARLDYQGRSQAEHRAILTAFAAGKRVAAVRALKDHILAGGRALAMQLDAARRRIA